jgi:hypothetical protein
MCISDSEDTCGTFKLHILDPYYRYVPPLSFGRYWSDILLQRSFLLLKSFTYWF